MPLSSRGVSEQAALEAAVQRVHFEIEVGDHQIQPAVAVVVAGIDAHAGARLAVGADGDAGDEPGFREPHVPRVVEQKVRHRRRSRRTRPAIRRCRSRR